MRKFNNWLLALFFISPAVSLARPGHATSKTVALQCRQVAVHMQNFAWRQYDASESTSQKLRDNAPSYWLSVRGLTMESAYQKLPESLRRIMVSLGDGHSGNFTIFLNELGQVVYSFFDIKDIGQAPGLMDFNRLVLNTLAIARENKKYDRDMEDKIYAELFDAYMDGFNRKQLILSKQFKDILPSADDMREEISGKRSRVTKRDKFKTEGGRVEPATVAARKLGIPVSFLRAEIEEKFRILYNSGRLLDVVTRPRDRGGSKDALRMWVHFEIADRGTRIFKELKEEGTPATAAFDPNQASMVDNYQQASKYMDYNINQVVPTITIAGRNFQVREKKIEVVSVPYQQRSEGDLKYLIGMAKEHARWFGTFQARQLAEGKMLQEFIDDLMEHRPYLIEMLRKFNRGLIKTAEKS